MTTPRENEHPSGDQILINLDRIEHEIGTIRTCLDRIADLLGIPTAVSSDD